MKDSKCPCCGSKSIVHSYMYAAGDKYECLDCTKMWGWYYDRNLTENKFKSDPNN